MNPNTLNQSNHSHFPYITKSRMTPLGMLSQEPLQQEAGFAYVRLYQSEVGYWAEHVPNDGGRPLLNLSYDWFRRI